MWIRSLNVNLLSLDTFTSNLQLSVTIIMYKTLIISLASDTICIMKYTRWQYLKYELIVVQN